MFAGLLVPNISGSMGSDCGPLEGTAAQKASRPRALHVDDRGWIMNNVLSLRLAGERARQPNGGPNGQALAVWNPQTTQLSVSKPRMRSFEAVSWISCSRFKHCAVVLASSYRHLAGVR
jgi:hypothetical protein